MVKVEEIPSNWLREIGLRMRLRLHRCDLCWKRPVGALYLGDFRPKLLNYIFRTGKWRYYCERHKGIVLEYFKNEVAARGTK